MSVTNAATLEASAATPDDKGDARNTRPSKSTTVSHGIRSLKDQTYSALIESIKTADENRSERALEIGRALQELQRRYKDARGAFQTEFGKISFERVVKQRIEYEKAHAYRLIRHAAICDVIAPLNKGLPNERQSRELAEFITDQDRLLEMWKILVKGNYKGDDRKRAITAGLEVVCDVSELPRVVAQAVDLKGPTASRRMQTVTRATTSTVSFVETLLTRKPDILANEIRESGRYDDVFERLNAILSSLSDKSFAIEAAAAA